LSENQATVAGSERQICDIEDGGIPLVASNETPDSPLRKYGLLKARMVSQEYSNIMN